MINLYKSSSLFTKDYLIFFLVILISADTVWFGTNSNPLTLYYNIIFHFILCCWCLLEGKCNVDKNAFYYSFVATFFVGCTILYNEHFSFGYLYFLLIIYSLCIYVSLYSVTQIMVLFVRTIYFISIFSLLLYSIDLLQPSILHFLPVIKNTADVEFYNSFFSVVFKDSSFPRNTAVFREPGVYAIYLNIAISLLLFNKQLFLKYKKFLLVFGACLFTTFSTAGYLCSIVLLLAYTLSSKNYQLIIPVIVVGLGGLTIPFVSDSVFNKLDNSTYEYTTTLARLSSFILPLKSISISPFFGVGLEGFVHYYELYSLEIYGRVFSAKSQSTNTLLNVAATFGIPFFIYLAINIFRFIKRTLIPTNVFSLILLGIFILALVSNEELRYSPLFHFIVITGVRNNIRKVENL